MNELIKVVDQGDQKLVDARDLYEKLGVKSRFNDWINNRIKDYGYVEGEDFFRAWGRAPVVVLRMNTT